MKTIKFPLIRTHIRRFFAHSTSLVTVALAAFFLGALSSRAQTQDGWIATSPDDFSDPTAWASGTVPGTLSQVVITNNGTCDYTTDDTNTIDQFWMGSVGTSPTKGGINTFSMSGGSLTMSDTGGNDFSIGGNSDVTIQKVLSTNTFTMTGGTLTVLCGSGENLIGYASNAIATVNFNGGTVDFGVSNPGSAITNGGLFIGGLGTGILNINGGNVSIDTSNNDYTTGSGSKGACMIGQGYTGSGGVGYGFGELNMMAGTLSVSNSTIHIGGKCGTNILNISGGTITSGSIAFGSGSGSSPTVLSELFMSGGTVSLTGGFGQNGADYTRSAVFSGGTLVSRKSWGFTAGMPNGYYLTNTPGVGYLTLAPNAGTVITCPSFAGAATNFTGPGALLCAGPGTVKLAGPHSFTGGLTVSGGTLDVNIAQIQALGLTDTGGNLQIDTVTNALLDSPISIPSGNTITFDNTEPIPFTNVVMGAGNLVVDGSGAVITNSGNFTYTGNTTVTKGDLVLTGAATIASPDITIGGAGTLDVSALSSPFTLASGQILSNSTSTATVAGNFVTASGVLSLTYASSTPSFAVTNGTMTISSGTALSINNTGAALGAGTYTLLGAGADGAVAGTVPASYTIGGNGLQANAESSLIISSSNTLDLVVTSTVNPNPAIVFFSVTNNQITLTWPMDHVGWTMQAQTNSLGTGLGTNWTNVAGSSTTNQETMTIDPANGCVFYRLVYTP